MTPGWSEQLGRITGLLADPGARLIGWGTGSVFDYFYDRQPLPLQYLVDNDASRHGERRASLTICGPDRLANEDPDRTLVIVYSAWWPEIAAQLNRLGFAHVAPASLIAALDADPGLRRRVSTLERLAEAGGGTRRPSGDRAIVIQGPVVPSMTPHVVRATAALHPRDRIILSTWDSTDLLTLSDLAPFVDDVVVSAAPKAAGIQNRNCQIVSTRAGLDRAREHGVRLVVKTRTDLALLEPDLFDRVSVEQRRPSVEARRHGLRGRLIVPSTFTRKYVLYHPSDLAMAGHLDDLSAYWSAPLDARIGALEDGFRDRISLRELCQGGNPAESYLATAFCRRVCRSMAWTVADSWTFLRDFFVVVDDDWFGLLWLKNLVTPDAGLRHGPRQLVTHDFWRTLSYGEDGFGSPLPEIDPGVVTLRDFGRAALQPEGAVA